ncbi:MAG: hypothetical protein Q4G55_10975 [bacterium]|nr:hypothetical protein [bacterium]MDO5313912.1 hypothetical protein [bacterium]
MTTFFTMRGNARHRRKARRPGTGNRVRFLLLRLAEAGGVW